MKTIKEVIIHALLVLMNDIESSFQIDNFFKSWKDYAKEILEITFRATNDKNILLNLELINKALENKKISNSEKINMIYKILIELCLYILKLDIE